MMDKNVKVGKGGAEDTHPIPAEFSPQGEPQHLSDDGSASAKGEMSETDKALAEFASLMSKGEKISSIKGGGKVTLTAKGGPGNYDVNGHRV